MAKKPAVSVLTPTYNRAPVLHRAYDSLRRQRTRDFEWVVVDEGSTDDTPELLARWQAEADFPLIWYRYAGNRGTNAAINTGVMLVSGDYTLILDSDDALLDDALQTIAHWRERTGIDSYPTVSGFCFRCVDELGALVGKSERGGEARLPRQTLTLSWREARYGLGFTYEFILVLKTAIARERRFVELDNAEHCPESITHDSHSAHHATIFVDHPIRRYFMHDGIARITDKAPSRVRRPRATYLLGLTFLNQNFDYFWRCPKRFLNAARKVTRLGLHLGRSPGLQLRDLTRWRARLLWALCLPAGLAGYLRDRVRGQTAPVAHPNTDAWGPAKPPEDAMLYPAPGRFGGTASGEALLVRRASPQRHPNARRGLA